jgi:hypothetical protein
MYSKTTNRDKLYSDETDYIVNVMGRCKDNNKSLYIHSKKINIRVVENLIDLGYEPVIKKAECGRVCTHIKFTPKKDIKIEEIAPPQPVSPKKPELKPPPKPDWKPPPKVPGAKSVWASVPLKKKVDKPKKRNRVRRS